MSPDFANGAITGAFAYAAGSWGQEAANDNEAAPAQASESQSDIETVTVTAQRTGTYDYLGSDIETVVVTGQSNNNSVNLAGYIQIAANGISSGPANDNFPRQRVCTTAGYECVQQGYPSGACYLAEQNCNMLSYFYKNYPEATPSHSVTVVFPNGSTVIIPEGYDPLPGVKVPPPGKPRGP